MKSTVSLLLVLASFVPAASARPQGANPAAGAGAAAGPGLAALPGPAVLTGFTSRTAWLTALGSTPTRVDFDALADGTLVTGTGALLPWGVADTFGDSTHGGGAVPQFAYCSCTMNFPMFGAGSLPSEPNYFANIRDSPTYATGTITLVFTQARTAVGLFVADGSPVDVFRIEPLDAGGVSLGVQTFPARALPDTFCGLLSDTAFFGVKISSASPNDSWGIDDFEHGGSVGQTYCFGDGLGSICPCANENDGSVADGEAGCANSHVAGGAALTASGSAHTSSADLVLVAQGLVSNQPGLYFQGDNATGGGSGALFGDGLRCAGGGVRRLGVRAADAAGSSSTAGLDVVALGGVVAGETKRYQLWYRDPANSPCGSGFNLTNGVEVAWLP
ncbi:MAG: hypothetical protein H6828_09255 [Planctomycetes bacterium]|nr:hypothetical protein [Planctomycetota bacterium]